MRQVCYCMCFYFYTLSCKLEQICENTLLCKNLVILCCLMYFRCLERFWKRINMPYISSELSASDISLCTHLESMLGMWYISLQGKHLTNH